MLHTVSAYMDHGCSFLEKGLAHPSFLGRAVSWGIFYGAISFLVTKVVRYATAKFSELWKNYKSTPNQQLKVNNQKTQVDDEHKEKIPRKRVSLSPLKKAPKTTLNISTDKTNLEPLGKTGEPSHGALQGDSEDPLECPDTPNVKELGLEGQANTDEN